MKTKPKRGKRNHSSSPTCLFYRQGKWSSGRPHSLRWELEPSSPDSSPGFAPEPLMLPTRPPNNIIDIKVLCEPWLTIGTCYSLVDRTFLDLAFFLAKALYATEEAQYLPSLIAMERGLWEQGRVDRWHAAQSQNKMMTIARWWDCDLGGRRPWWGGPSVGTEAWPGMGGWTL